MGISVRRLSYGLGAEVLGADLSRTLSDEDITQIRRAWIEHGIVLIRGQDITPEQHIAFSARFGTLDDHAALFKYRHPDHPEIFLVSNKPKADGTPSDTRNTGVRWHSDLSYTLRPAMGSLLFCREIPEVGGDTMFANTYLAYDTLSAGFKRLIDPLWAVHTFEEAVRETEGVRDPANIAAMKKVNRPVMQPMVRPHEETGRKTIYVSTGVTTHIVGMTREESQPILQYLYQHCIRPEFVYRHRWQRNDLIMWDNRCTMHKAVGDIPPGGIRHMHRTTVLGTPSGQLYEGA